MDMHGNQGIVDKYYAQIEGKKEVYQLPLSKLLLVLKQDEQESIQYIISHKVYTC